MPRNLYECVSSWIRLLCSMWRWKEGLGGSCKSAVRHRFKYRSYWGGGGLSKTHTTVISFFPSFEKRTFITCLGIFVFFLGMKRGAEKLLWVGGVFEARMCNNFLLGWGEEQQSSDVRGVPTARRSVLRVNELKKTGARNARAYSAAKPHLFNIKVSAFYEFWRVFHIHNHKRVWIGTGSPH
jgi:hypothetical protein